MLRGRGGQVERDLSFGLVRELFEGCLRDADAATRDRWLAGAAAPAERVLGDSFGFAAEPSAAAYGLYWLLASIAGEQPVVLLIDDLHECDPASLRWLAYLARRIEGLPVAVLAATRPVDALELSASRACACSGLLCSETGATAELITRRTGALPDPGFVEDCHAATGGNPLLLGELLSSRSGNGFGSTVLARIGRLEPAAAALARAVSVLGDGCELRHASQLAGLDPDAAITALASLVGHGVLADAQPLAFAHSLLREAVYLSMPAPVRAAEHGRAAVTLYPRSASIEVIAHHLLRSEPIDAPWAPVALEASAQIAITRGDPDAAVAYLRRALEERPDALTRGETLRSLGNALARLGDPAAVDVLGEALELTRRPSIRAEIVDESIDLLLARGRTDDCRRLLGRVLEERKSLDSERRLRLLGRLAAVRARDDSGDDRALDELRALEPTLTGSTSGERYAAAALAVLHAMREGTAASATRLARIALADEEGRRIDQEAGRPAHIARVALAIAGEPDEALDGLDDALAVSRARGSLMGQALGTAWAAFFHAIAGNVTEAENAGRASLALLEDTGLSGPTLGALVAVGWALMERGELDEAEALLATAPESVGWGTSALACVRAQLLIARHRHAEALVEIAPVEQLAGDARIPGPRSWRALAATAWLGTGDRDGAIQLAQDDLAEARRFGSPLHIGAALRVLGLVGDDVETRLLAIETLRVAGARLELAHALVELGAALRRAGERAASREPLLEGLELAAACGATALVETARTELRAAGARPRSVVRSGVDVAHAERAPRRGSRRRGPRERRDRAGAVRHGAHRRDAPERRLPQARDLLARRAVARAGVGKPYGRAPWRSVRASRHPGWHHHG